MPNETKPQIVDALLGLLASKPYAEIGLGDIAARAGLSLGELREAYDGKIDILADFMRRIDRAVLDATETPSTDESGRDRLFDLIMKRLDEMAPYRAAIGHLAESARRDPALALCLNRVALGSARFMLAGAGISTDGLRGAARTQGFVLMISRVLPVWLKDEDPDLSKTMAALDRALEHAETWSRRTDRAAGLVCRVANRLHRHRPERRPSEPKPDTAQPAA
ncbi:TetR/AcrR family transcriptional regulator [Kaistia defluvii]|uniref:TetR/AcrR family transcriptional regulator n=1 Tax=Kaistia defluvii TaxID=410841 RepID=UPI002252CDC1|nr:TetR/AcrR family transcriptional regulator [Kaistia defluvii]MCX5517144.1 TetR/AcrR family transcriptional regulator [Kaistia defluvii]